MFEQKELWKESKWMSEFKYRKFCDIYNDEGYWMDQMFSNYDGYTPDNWEQWEPYFSDLVDSWLDMTGEKPKSVLVLGGAFGFTVKIFMNRGIRAIGLDVSRLAVGNQIAPMFMHNLIDPIPLPANSFDLITASDVLEHIPSNLLPMTIDNIAEVSCGYLVTRIPMSGPGYSEDRDVTHLTFEVQDWWKELIGKRFTYLKENVFNKATQMLFEVTK